MTLNTTASDFRKGDVFYIRDHPGYIGVYQGEFGSTDCSVLWTYPDGHKETQTYGIKNFTMEVYNGYFYRVNRAEPFTDEEYKEFFV